MGNCYDVVCITSNVGPDHVSSHSPVPQDLKRCVVVLCQTVAFLISVLQTATVMTWFMLAMIAYPEVQKKCQEELDRVVGRSRMPTLRDRESLPYIRATLRELFRWRALTPIGGLLSNMNRSMFTKRLVN